MLLTLPTLLLSVTVYLIIGSVTNALIWNCIFKKRVMKIYEGEKNLWPKNFSQKKVMISSHIFLFISGVFLTILIKLSHLGDFPEGLDLVHGFIIGLLVWMIGVVIPNLTWILYIHTPRDLMSLNILTWFFILCGGGIAISAIISA